ncbi:TPA: aminomethyltransferase family protein [Pseudomonas aeruginosa]|nr:aminomethyltransferase family protein [Pseudomonas aeruginosa]
MNLPVISRPLEPALFARAPGLERHRVAPGGLTVVALEPGDRLEVIDLEGDQPAELLAFAGNGRATLAALGLTASPGADFIAHLLHDGSLEAAHVSAGLVRRGIDCRHLPHAARLWPAGKPAGFSRSFSASEALLVIVAAPGGQTPVDSQSRASDLRLLIHRANPRRVMAPPLPAPLGELVDEFTITPGSARDYLVAAGQYIQVLDVAGRQCSDFVAFDRRGLDAGREIDLDPTVTRTLNGNAYPGPGLFSRFFDRNLQPMLEVVRDTVGRHDTFALACTARYYEAQGYFGHANCSDNISRAVAKHGVQGRAGWPAINFFFNTGVDVHQHLTLDEPWSRPGDYVLLRAMTDLVCASSSCPDDIDPANGWQPTDIHIRVYSEQERFSIAMATRKTPDADPVLTRESGFHPGTSALTRQFVDYRGFWTPIQFDGHGAIEEYHGCREKVAVMDLSALRKFEVLGPDAEALLDYCLTRDVRKLAVGQVVYSAICFEHGGMLDDGTLLRLGPDAFRWIGGEDYAGVWLREQAEKLGMKVWIKSASEQIHNIAVQGPLARTLLKDMIWTPGTQPKLEDLGWFRFLNGRLDDYNGAPLMVSRTGYTGELGYEIWCHPSDALKVWNRLWQLGEPLGLVPLGLQALDMLRIEAGLIFAGYEFSDQTDPLEAGIGFCVPLKTKQADFIGKDALLRRSAHPQQRLVGLELEGNEPAAHGDCVRVGRAQVGVVTSATRSPVLGKNIALCRLDIGYCEPGTTVEIGKLDGQQKRIRAHVAASTVAYDPEKTRVRG